MGSSESDSRSDWEIVRLPTLFGLYSRDGETVLHEDLRWALTTWERVAPETADLVIQSAIEDGILERHNGEVLRLSEDVVDPFEDSDDDE